MRYLLDTNAVIAMLNRDENFVRKIKNFIPSDFALSSIVMFELYFGAEKSIKIMQNKAKLRKLPFNILDFNLSDAKVAGKIRATLNKQGTPIGSYDVLIAGQAVANDLILITHNVKEFKRIPELSFEDWLN